MNSYKAKADYHKVMSDAYSGLQRGGETLAGFNKLIAEIRGLLK